MLSLNPLSWYVYHKNWLWVEYYMTPRFNFTPKKGPFKRTCVVFLSKNVYVFFRQYFFFFVIFFSLKVAFWTFEVFDFSVRIDQVQARSLGALCLVYRSCRVGRRKAWLTICSLSALISAWWRESDKTEASATKWNVKMESEMGGQSCQVAELNEGVEISLRCDAAFRGGGRRTSDTAL